MNVSMTENRIRDLDIAINYLATDKTLATLAKEHGVSKGRVGAIVNHMLRVARHPRYHAPDATLPPTYPISEARKHKDVWIKIMKQARAEEQSHLPNNQHKESTVQVKQTGYEIVEGDTVEDLTKKVASLMTKGWEVTGGLMYKGYHGTLLQAMVSHEQPEVAKVKEYILVDKPYTEDLMKEVNSLIAQGWVPFAGPSVSSYTILNKGFEETAHSHVQAMVKY